MPLPASVNEAYFRSTHPEMREWWAIVARRAPDNIQSRVSELTSLLSEGKCIFKDAQGNVLYETPDPPTPVETKKSYGPDRNFRDHLSRRLGLANSETLKHIADLCTELFNRVKALEEGSNIEGALAGVHDVQQGLSSRLKAIETKTAGIQAKVDREGRGVCFRGSWQQTIDYEAGSIVTAGKRAFVALKAVRPGGEAPSRAGSGWSPLFDASHIPGEPQLESVADEVAGVIREMVNPLKDRLASLEHELALVNNRT